MITATKDKKVSVQNLETDYQAEFSKHQVKPYFRDQPETDADMEFAEVLHSALKSFVPGDAVDKAPS